MSSHGQGSISFSPKGAVIPAQVGYTIGVGGQAINPLDGLTYFFGNFYKSPVVTAIESNVFFPVAGIVKIANINSFTAAVIGTNENISVFIRLNNAVDVLVATIGAATRERTFLNNALAIPVTAADFFQIKMVCPVWATNPTGVSFGGWLYIE